MAVTPFDQTAHGYDQEFTGTQVGRLQRAVTHRFLKEWTAEEHPRSVLELNCGTGEDALWMAQQGMHVTATDLSAEMVEITTRKVEGTQVQVVQASIQDIRRALPHATFDLVWSNFGGLNCLAENEIQAAVQALHHLLNPNGRFVAVVMGRFCAWETLYFTAKLRLRQAWRRQRKGPVPAQLAAGVYQDTYYYSPRKFERLFAPHFIPQRRMAIGAYLPPSYLDPFFTQRPKLLARMARWEDRAYHQRFPATFSDHFLVAFRRK